MSPPLFRCTCPKLRPAESPDVGVIESSLRNCSLRGAAGNNRHLPMGGLHPGTAAITVDLNSEVPLPYPWEQILNIQTGEIYYLNKVDGSKINRDPRRPPSFSDSDSSSESGVYDEGDEGGDKEYESESEALISDETSSDDEIDTTTTVTTTTASSCTTSSASSAISTASSRRRSTHKPVLILVGCQACLTLSMVPRPGLECPKCGSTTLRHF